MAKRKRQKQQEDSYFSELAKMDPTAKQRANIIFEAMKEKDIGLNELATKMDISTHLLLLFIMGRSNIRIEPVLEMCKILDLNAEDVMQKIEQEQDVISEEPDVQKKITNGINHVELKDVSLDETPSSILTEAEIDEIRNEEEPVATFSIGDESFGNELKEKRIAAGITQVDLGKACGFDRAAIVDIEKGRAFPTKTMMLKMADELGLTRNELDHYLIYLSAPENLKKPSPVMWVPSEDELHAMITLCTESGKAKAYMALWDILQEPSCRKGGLYAASCQ